MVRFTDVPRKLVDRTFAIFVACIFVVFHAIVDVFVALEFLSQAPPGDWWLKTHRKDRGREEGRRDVRRFRERGARVGE